jgi:hypothetical protein
MMYNSFLTSRSIPRSTRQSASARIAFPNTPEKRIGHKDGAIRVAESTLSDQALSC